MNLTLFFTCGSILVGMTFKLLVMHDCHYHFITLSSCWQWNLLCLRLGLVLSVYSGAGQSSIFFLSYFIVIPQGAVKALPEVISYVCANNCENVTADTQHEVAVGQVYMVLHLLQQFHPIQEQKQRGWRRSHLSKVITAVSNVESTLGEREEHEDEH